MNTPVGAVEASKPSPVGMPPAAARERISGRKLGTLLCGSGAPFLIMLDTNIVAVSLPSIARDLHGAFTDLEWVVSAYVLPFAALLLPAGTLSDRLGRRRMLLLGLAIFTLASLLCGLAPSLAVLNAARALQALGAALQLTASLAVLAHGFEAEQRARVYAIWGTVMGLAPSLGPTVGGLVTSYLGWRWAFLLNLPVGLGLILLAGLSVNESRDPDASRLDIPGILLFGTGLFAVVWALIGANGAGWGSASTLIKLAGGAGLLGVFVYAERLHPRPMIDLSLFRNHTVVGAAITMLGYAGTAQVMMTILPLYIQDAFGYPPVVAGLAMMPFAFPLLVCPGIGGRLAARTSSRAILTSGLVLTALGNAATAAAVMATPSYWAAAIGMFVIGCGAGLLNSETVKAVVSAMPPARAGMASGISATMRFVGISIGIAGLGAVLAGVAEDSLRRHGAPLVSPQAVDWHTLSLRVMGGDAGGSLSVLPVEVRAAVGRAVQDSVAAGFSAALATAASVAALSSLLCWRLGRPPGDPRTQA